jgi:uncharacterized protein with HEPN domain
VVKTATFLAYPELTLDIVWQTVTEDITPLLEELKKLNLNNS